MAWPADLDPQTICFSVDVEWAAAPVLDDLRGLFDACGIRATFFVTHAGVDVPGHERGLHPNFRRNGDSYRALLDRSPDGAARLTEEEIYRHIVSVTKAFAPEARGLRAHSLFFDSALVPIYREAGLEYDCSILMPFVPGIRPFWREHGMVALPTYYADHFDIMTGSTGFDVGQFGLDRPGIKVIDLHPNIVYLNAANNVSYLESKPFYRDAERLLAARHPGKGIRTFLMDLLDAIVARRLPTMTVGEVNGRWRRDLRPA